MDEFKSSTQIDIIHKMSKASYFNTVKLIRLLVFFLYAHTIMFFCIVLRSFFLSESNLYCDYNSVMANRTV